MKVRPRTMSTLFSLMFAQKVYTQRGNDETKEENEKEKVKPSMMEEMLMKQAVYLQDVVFPSIKEKFQKAIRKIQQEN
ncbi:hypothetical protein A0J61_08530 [Choanephora cucurbitarum]|uniref:Uncharacterized protein n=1 Tax=Choanephora cucurbitarum TaxID=101091 RepID=A0A1C7N454_9FUNG|nr:hypothetical protein A0J61_08530 [Choanephora cucurbitarum]